MTANAFHNISQIEPSLGSTADSLYNISERISIDYYCMPLPGAVCLRSDLLLPHLMSGELAA